MTSSNNIRNKGLKASIVKLSLMQEYLLLFTDPPMCHVSISSNTIMLDENFTAKVPKQSLEFPRSNFAKKHVKILPFYLLRYLMLAFSGPR